MPITVVNTYSGSTNNANSLTISGIVALENDYLVVAGGYGLSSGAVGQHAPSTVGYTAAGTIEGTASTGADCEIGVWYKKMGATPDIQVDLPGTTAATQSTAYTVFVLRGVDGTTPLAGTVTSTGDSPTTDGSAGQSPAITTTSNNAWVLSFIFDVHTAGSSVSNTAAPSGYSDLVSVSQNDSGDVTLGASGKIVATAGVETPGVYTDDYTTERWSGITVAFAEASGGETAPNTRMRPGLLMTVGNVIDDKTEAVSTAGGARRARMVFGRRR